MKVGRNKLISFLIIAAVIFGVMTVSPLYVWAQEEKTKIILIDPGHGGRDGGAKSKNNVSEKDINLAISKKIRDLLVNDGFKVYLTREEDVDLKSEKVKTKSFKVSDLTRRCELKEETGCDMFISIHLNKFTDYKPKGAQVWYSSYEKSKVLADILQNGFKEDIDPANHRLAKHAGTQYKILRDKFEGPAVIIECGFLSNPEEERLLQTDDYQEKIAGSIAKSIKKYYDAEKR